MYTGWKSYDKLLEQAQQEYSTADDMYSVLGKIFKEKIVNVFKTIFELKDVIQDEAIDYNLLSEKIFTEAVRPISNVVRLFMSSLFTKLCFETWW